MAKVDIHKSMYTANYKALLLLVGCPEASTCSSTPGYCNVPVLEFGYVPNNIISDVSIVCVVISAWVVHGAKS